MNKTFKKTDYTVALAFGFLVFVMVGFVLSNVWIALMLGTTAFFAALPNRASIEQVNQEAIVQEQPVTPPQVQYYYPTNTNSQYSYYERE